MQISKLRISLAVTTVLSAATLCAQNSFSSMGIGSINSPAMPSITSPTISSGFYVPGNPSNYNYSQQKNGNSQNNSDTAKASSSEKKSELSADILSNLTAGDLANLSSLGLLDSFNNLTGSTARINSLYNSADTTAETKILLQKILAEIETIKDLNKAPEISQQSQESAASVSYSKETPKSSSEIPSATAKASKILRFSVNGYDILKTCSKVYISDVQNDGTFLVTGDRKYMSDGKSRKETFHILFKTAPNENGASNYTAAAAVSQDYQNEYSFLYQLTKKDNLCANRVGNLITMKTPEPDWQLDLLIDLGNK